ncbi:T9SS type A sorting domain-containing protein [Adhaeribacter terreus]|uniref:T9SS type A sorting domain-containing protein n=1 Tax=Adhaeribacter terreus TaxID=529703 RepID=A0ABW0E9A4_9BACT
MKKRYTFLPENWFRVGLGVAIVASLSLNTSAQNGPTIQWDKSFGGSGNDYLRSLRQTTDGGYFLGGYSNSGTSADKSQASNGLSDYWFIRLTANGIKTMDKTIGAGNDDLFSSAQQTSDGGFILGGSSNSGISGDKSQATNGGFDYWIVKLDANGIKTWDKTFGGSARDELYSLEQTSDGGYILGGTSYSGISGDKSQASSGLNDFWVIKIDANGNKLWDKTYGGNDGDLLRSLKQTSDGGYILGGTSSSGISGDKTQASRGSSDYWVVKLDNNGNKVWDKTIGGSSADAITALQQTADGGYILGGYSSSNISGDKSQNCQGGYDFWVVKLNSSGGIIWDKTIGGNGEDELYSIQQTLNGSYILGGFSESGLSGNKTQPSRGGADFWVTKLDNNGIMTWDKSFGGDNHDGIFSAQQTVDGGFILGGYSLSSFSGDKSQTSQGMSDYWIVKLGTDVTGLKEFEASFTVSISPNPNQGKFTLQLNNLTAPKAEVTVSDLLGRVVLQQPLNVSNKQISEELTLPQAKGMYLLQIKAGKQIIPRKIVVE